MATNSLSTMRFHWPLGIFVIIFTRFSLISQSILNRFSCNFAGTTCNYSGDCPEKLVEFERVLLKLLVRLVVNLLEYFKSYSFRRQFRRQFSIVFHVILQKAWVLMRLSQFDPLLWLVWVMFVEVLSIRSSVVWVMSDEALSVRSFVIWVLSDEALCFLSISQSMSQSMSQ